MTTERTFQGAWRISDIVADRYVTRQYFFYTKKEAIAKFKAECRELVKGV